MAPNAAAPSRPTQGPYQYVKYAAPQVPSSIWPSSPMLTTPARSDQRPPRAASRIGQPTGTAAVSAAAEAMSLAPESAAPRPRLTIRADDGGS